MAKGKKGMEAVAHDTAETKKVSYDGKRELVELKTKAKFETFRPRFQVNADKLELVFEVSWDHMPVGMMEKIKTVAQKFGELTFVEAATQVEPKPPKGDLPGQQHLPLGGEEEIR